MNMPRPRTRKNTLSGVGAPCAHDLAFNVIENRHKKGVSQTALAKAAKLSLRTVSRVERAEAVADLNTVAALADALGITPKDLLKEANGRP